jgi:hypothetical protein
LTTPSGPFCTSDVERALLDLAELGWPAELAGALLSAPRGWGEALVVAWGQEVATLRTKLAEMRARAMAEGGMQQGEAASAALQEAERHYTAWTGRKLTAAAARRLGIVER